MDEVPRSDLLRRPAPPTGGDMDRRSFLKICSLAAAAIGLPMSAARDFAAAAAAGLKPSVIWLSFQECTGCTETLLRSTHPGLADLLLDLISLDYHETLCAAAGHQVEAVKQAAMKRHAGEYVLITEGATPTKDGGIYCQIGDRTALEVLEEAAAGAGAIIAIGSCASFGGMPAADPNPTEAKGTPMILTDKTVVTLPGCPPNPYNLLGTVLQFATYGTLPALDEKGRPLFAYGRVIHEDCARRPHFDAGRFAETYGDEGHREGHCLYRLGCKGPATHANCSRKDFCEVDGAWPIGIGAPCHGCTEQALAFRVPTHETIDVERPTPPDTYAPIYAEHKGISPIATGLGGAIGGAVIGAGIAFAHKLGQEDGGGES